MNSKPVIALPEVAEDLRLGKAHYASWRPDGAEHFLGKFLETVDFIGRTPDAFPCKYGPVQRALLERSFYIAYFVQEPDRSVVLAVLDGRRSPSDIRRIVGLRRVLPRPPRE